MTKMSINLHKNLQKSHKKCYTTKDGIETQNQKKKKKKTIRKEKNCVRENVFCCYQTMLSEHR